MSWRWDVLKEESQCQTTYRVDTLKHTGGSNIDHGEVGTPAVIKAMGSCSRDPFDGQSP